jgi:DNA repair exonuclease SbcCD ATPase subunit
LDEVFSSLDSKARIRLIQLLYALQSKFESIVIISHIPELKAQIPSVITVKRKRGLSRIVAGEG